MPGEAKFPSSLARRSLYLQLAFYDATISCHQDYRQPSIMKCHAKTPVQSAMNDTLSLKLELRVNNAPNTAVKHVM